MREVVIVLTDLYFAGSEAAATTHQWKGLLPAIEQAGRFGERARLASGWRDWLAATVGRGDLAGIAPARVAAAVLPPAPGTSWLATPVHLSAGLSQVHLDHRGLLRLDADARALLVAAFAREFGSAGLELVPLGGADFILRAAGIGAVPTTEPARCAGGEVASSLPRGPASVALRRAGAEIEMWLHALGAQGARSVAGAPPLNGLWLWGAAGREGPVAVAGGPPPLPAFGADAYLCGLWHLLGSRSQGLPQHLDVPPTAQGAVLTLAVADELSTNMQATFLEALRGLDERFVAPALARLRAGALERVTLIANDTAVVLGRRSHWQRWRRTVAGLESFA